MPDARCLEMHIRLILAAQRALAGDGVVVDCRSSTYAAAWTPTGDAGRQLLAVRVFTEVAGRRTVVSHLAKHTRGQVARILLEHPGRLRTVADVAAAVAGNGHRCELVDHGRVVRRVRPDGQFDVTAEFY